MWLLKLATLDFFFQSVLGVAAEISHIGFFFSVLGVAAEKGRKKGPPNYFFCGCTLNFFIQSVLGVAAEIRH